MRKLIYYIIILFCFVDNIFANQKLFYKNPNQESINAIIKEFENSTHTNQQALIIYLTLIFKQYPQLVGQLKLQNYSAATQQYIAQSILNSGSNKKLPAKYNHLKKQNINLEALYKTPPESPEDLYHNMQLTDLLWCAYYVTGKAVYLEKILRFVASHTVKIRTIAYEITNREQLNTTYDDISDHMTKEQFYEVLGCKTVIWSLDSNRKQHKDIDNKIKLLISKSAALDYVKDVKL